MKRDRIVLKASPEASVKKRKQQIFDLEAEAEGLRDEERSWLKGQGEPFTRG